MQATDTPAVILRTRPTRESDLVVALLTATGGKVDCIARGARKSRKRFPGGLPVGARGQATIARGRGELSRLDGFSPTADTADMGRDLVAFAHVAYACELCDVMVGGTTPDPTVFARLCTALEDLARHGEAAAPGIARALELGVLDRLGLLPALDSCAVCGAETPAFDEQVRWDPERGGALCSRHGARGGLIDERVLELARSLVDDPAGGPTVAGAPAAVRRGLRDLCLGAVRPHLRRPLKSLEFLAALPRAAKAADKAESAGNR